MRVLITFLPSRTSEVFNLINGYVSPTCRILTTKRASFLHTESSHSCCLCSLHSSRHSHRQLSSASHECHCRAVQIVCDTTWLDVQYLGSHLRRDGSDDTLCGIEGPLDSQQVCSVQLGQYQQCRLGWSLVDRYDDHCIDLLWDHCAHPNAIIRSVGVPLRIKTS